MSINELLQSVRPAISARDLAAIPGTRQMQVPPKAYLLIPEGRMVRSVEIDREQYQQATESGVLPCPEIGADQGQLIVKEALPSLYVERDRLRDIGGPIVVHEQPQRVNVLTLGVDAYCVIDGVMSPVESGDAIVHGSLYGSRIVPAAELASSFQVVGQQPPKIEVVEQVRRAKRDMGDGFGM